MRKLSLNPSSFVTATAIIFFLPAFCSSAEAKPDWQSEWEKTVQAAKKEAKLSLYLYQGEGELGAVAQLFQKKYPEISVTTVTGRGNQLGPPHPHASRVFVNWLFSREGQTAFQRAANTPTNSEESMRIDIPKEMIAADARRLDGVKYLLADKPEFMDMAPIYEVLDKALAQAKKK
jgi:hypothetical protein